jgi:primosomal protein N'
MRTRALLEGFTLVFFGPTPSVEILAAGAEMKMVGTRAWPLVEVVDRREEPPGSGFLGPSVIAALRAMVRAGERSFVYTSRRMVEEVVTEVNARLGRHAAGPGPSDAPILVGTERDLAALSPVGLAVATNPDGMLLGRGFRTSEEVLRQLARLAISLKSGSGHRMMVQTLEPGSDLVETLRKGDPIPYLERVLIERLRGGFPPGTEMIAVEVRGEIPTDVDKQLRGIDSVGVVGPVEFEGGRRWLLEGELREARAVLRELASGWRAKGATLRVDVDPIDL